MPGRGVGGPYGRAGVPTQAGSACRAFTTWNDRGPQSFGASSTCCVRQGREPGAPDLRCAYSYSYVLVLIENPGKDACEDTLLPLPRPE